MPVNSNIVSITVSGETYMVYIPNWRVVRIDSKIGRLYSFWITPVGPNDLVLSVLSDMVTRNEVCTA